MIVVVEPVLSIIGNEDVWPSVVIEIPDGDAEAPAVVGDPGLFGDVGKCSVVVVVKERGMGEVRLPLIES